MSISNRKANELNNLGRFFDFKTETKQPSSIKLVPPRLGQTFTLFRIPTFSVDSAAFSQCSSTRPIPNKAQTQHQRNPALPPQYKKKSAYIRNHIEVTLALFYCVYSSSSSSSAFLASFLTCTAAFLCSSVSLALRLKLLSGVNSFFSLGDGSSRIFSWTLS